MEIHLLLDSPPPESEQNESGGGAGLPLPPSPPPAPPPELDPPLLSLSGGDWFGALKLAEVT